MAYLFTSTREDLDNSSAFVSQAVTSHHPPSTNPDHQCFLSAHQVCFRTTYVLYSFSPMILGSKVSRAPLKQQLEIPLFAARSGYTCSSFPSN